MHRFGDCHIELTGSAQANAGASIIDDRARHSAEATPTLGLSAAKYQAVAEAFDPAYYRATYPDVTGGDAALLAEYMTEGWRRGRDPSAAFSTRFYLAVYPDIVAAGINPFLHYVTSGHREKRVPHPAANPALAAMFDADFYRATYGLEGDAAALLADYMIDGWQADRDPSEAFSTRFYMEAHPDVAAAGIHPFMHYVKSGHREGRLASPAGNAALVAAFDADFYRKTYAVEGSDAALLADYMIDGWRQGRDPSETFTTQFYLETNPDVVATGMNPFLHYVTAGRKEGRLGFDPGGDRAARLRQTVPLEARLKSWRVREVPDELLDAAALIDAVRGAADAPATQLIVSVGHDHYRRERGGIQVCIQREEDLARERGAVYLNIHPFSPLPRLAHADEGADVPVCVLIQGREVGVARTSALVDAVARLAGARLQVDLVVHHLLGHMPEQIADLARASGGSRCLYWAHDYFAICPSYTLQRNDIAYCHAPPPRSNACDLCLYGAERRTHRARMQTFFEALDVELICPSAVTAALYERRSGLRIHAIRVSPHVTLDWHAREAERTEPGGPATIAFVGTPALHKGWDVFRALVKRHAADETYRFVYLGSAPPPTDGVDFVPVEVKADDLTAMSDAIAREEVDLVLHWASWPETFSLSTYEALAGGAWVLTNPISGNVAATVERFGKGAVLADEADLRAFVTDGRLREAVAALRAVRRRQVVRSRMSTMSFAALDDAAPPRHGRASER